jgi:putative hemolysin
VHVHNAAEGVVDGLTSISEMMARLGSPGSEPLSTTMGGYVAERLDRIPRKGDEVAFGDYDLRVEEMDGLRVAKIKFMRRSKEALDAGQKA